MVALLGQCLCDHAKAAPRFLFRLAVEATGGSNNLIRKVLRSQTQRAVGWPLLDTAIS